ncbi:pyridoxal 5'-phosphate synthase glutaminase subunit PdxT [Candidatus Gracilibacteria bacterium]|nr:pyridoxal 5'-phosphate synthase glutaminase subunit PdxT [Candidatus Gracilibacteria bacterium]MCF7819628.1 pyridoxal 5'-phosphate synthase glutaminase subunit PdxT [Candidatus Gracilibacteria bacterium]
MALQGSFAEHAEILQTIGADFSFVRCREDVQGLTHLIIPGGESSTLTKLLKDSGMWEEILKQVQDDTLQILGTCAGAILLEKLGMDLYCDRNGYGAQQESFLADLQSEKFPNLKGVFIRAPKFSRVGKKGINLATLQKEPVMVEQGNFLALAFHPELVGETRIHEYFLKK